MTVLDETDLERRAARLGAAMHVQEQQKKQQEEQKRKTRRPSRGGKGRRK